MTTEERLSRMERRIRTFSIVVTGRGFVEGGFGPLPHSTDTGQRIANVSRSIDQFRLVGSGADVTGSFDDGYKIS